MPTSARCFKPSPVLAADDVSAPDGRPARSRTASGVIVRTLRCVCLILPAAVTLGALALFALTIARPSPHRVAERLTGPTMPSGMHAPAFSLTDQAGDRAASWQYRGKVVVVSFMYSECRTSCPLMATEIRGALDDLPDSGHNVPVLAISVDPAHDNPVSAGASSPASR